MTSWLLRNSLWLAALCLAVASSGLDGCYMATWMPQPVAWLGYVLNTVADLSGLAIMYNFGRLQQTPLNEAGGKRKRKLSRVLLVAEGVTVLYSAFFSWRQLRIVLPATEPTDWPWVALVSAGFVPLLLAAIGYTQALLAGRFEEERIERADMKTETELQTAVQEAPKVVRETRKEWQREPQIETATAEDVSLSEQDNGREPLACGWCGRSFATQNALNAHARWCEKRVLETSE